MTDLTKRQAAALTFALVALFAALLLLVRAQAQDASPRVQASDLTYVGAFRVPSGSDDQHTFKYGGRGLAFDARNGGLWMIGHDQQQWIAEVGIPTPSSSTTVAALPMAALLHDWRDGLAGSMGPIGQSGVFVGGILPQFSGMVLSAYTYYDASKQAKVSHVFVPESGPVEGPYRVGAANPGFVAGPMTPIPPEWQDALGGPALTAQCCIPIISRTSLGPSATVFDPAHLTEQADATMVVGYPIDHPTLGTYEDRDPSHLFLTSTAFAGLAFPPGTSSVLFVGVQPGTACYGQGTSDPKLDGTPYNGTVYCYDPTNKYKGTHGYPYRGFVWAYDANDLVRVKQGQAKPWDVKPYATWTLTAPFMSDARTAIQGATYDPATRRLYLSLGFADGTAPVVAVYQLAVGSGSVNENPPPVEPPDMGDTPPVVTVPPPSTVTAAAPTATITAATCSIKSIRARMPEGGGWTAEFFDGDKSLGKDAGGPATRPAQTVGGGVHSLTVRWTKAGQPDVVTPPLVLECR
jgi:hypothetical protein